MRALAVVLALGQAGPAGAQDLFASARPDAADSAVTGTRAGGTQLTLALSQPVPWRIFTLDAPPRLVIDFREVDWAGFDAGALRREGAPVREIRAGSLRPGWSRLVLDLAAPQELREAGMRVDPVTGRARLRLITAPTDAETFAARAGAPREPFWAGLAASDPTAPAPVRAGDGVLVVAIDPGHGGIDPGATRDGVHEADLMLELARDLAMAVTREEGMRAVLTREADVFVPLEERMTIARAAGADVLISLHADALELDQAAGASVYVLSDQALEDASQRMAERHSRADLLAGLDLSGQDDTVATVLMELARLETVPQSRRLQQALVAGLGQVGARLTARPQRRARLAVLMAADFPSVLLEAGFLSNDADRAALQTPQGRAPIVAGIIAGLRIWATQEAELAPLRRR